MENPILTEEILSERYQIIRELGKSVWGRTYLVQDVNRFNEYCVLKEFDPPIRGKYALQKAKDLFAQEVGVLHQLEHPQIPSFRELFRVQQEGKEHLFLVQDYIEGETYGSLARSRSQKEASFSEAEIKELLLKLLPVLEYLHSQGVIHRNISPDKIMLRSQDGLPVLFGFGSIKEIVLTVAAGFVGQKEIPKTDLKAGFYLPTEQIKQGIVSPSSDLYALAATALFLLTGKEPPQLIDPQTLTWYWEQDINLSAKLTNILNWMLATNPEDRPQSAKVVLESLQTFPTLPRLQLNENVKVGGASVPISTPLKSPPPKQTKPKTEKVLASPKSAANPWLNAIVITSLFLSAIGLAGLGGWTAGNMWLRYQLVKNVEDEPLDEPTDFPTDDSFNASSRFSVSEQKQRNQLRSRRLELGINYNFYADLVNEAFWEKYPEQQGQELSNDQEDTKARENWQALAGEWLEKLAFLSPEARERLGNYDQQMRNDLVREANQFRLSSRSLSDLTDAKFFHLFPEQIDQSISNKPIGQVQDAIFFDQLAAIRSGDALERIVFSEEEGEEINRVRGTLQPGEGKAYISELNADQIATFALQAQGDALLSIYSPTGTYILLNDSETHDWSGTLPETGFYEFTIVSTTDTPFTYRFEMGVETSIGE